MRDFYNYLIIGGGVAGVTAAETIRARDRDGLIGILSAEPHRLYSRVLLPSYVRGDIDREKVFLRKEGDYQASRIDFLPNVQVSFVNTQKGEVGLANHTTIGYKKLLIASGGKTAPSNLDGYDEYVYRLQTLDDADRLRTRFRDRKFRSPIIIGGSLIALEFLSLAAAYKVPARLLFRSHYFFSRLMGPQGGEFMRRIFSDRGFTIVPEDEVMDAAENEGFLQIKTMKLVTFDHDAIFLGIGLNRNTDFLAGANVEIGEGVKTNECLETNVPDVYAAGDIAEFHDVLFNRSRVVGNWTNSFLQGKLAGMNMTGGKLVLRVVTSYATTHFGLAIAALGDCTESAGSVERANFQKNIYERYFIHEHALVGAVLVNKNDSRSHATALIETRTPLDGFYDRMKGSTFDIREIPIVKS
jgi:NADPH-dependent 2,4-dienoyl-CoA reductase/sulfur reductase-like enzyme